jgi:hypothetical protein
LEVTHKIDFRDGVASVAGLSDWREVVDLKCLYHLGRLIVDGTMIIPGEEQP